MLKVVIAKGHFGESFMPLMQAVEQLKSAIDTIK